ncbi:MAG: gluconate 2-dehydrogenase subunit 3 family protein [Reichenbachiella sp.]
MERRETLKAISLVLGYSVTPAVLTSILTSCNNEANVNWQPKFFSKEEAFGLEQLSNLILPKTDTPGALDVNAHIFADLFLADVVNEKEQLKIKKGVKIWLKSFEDKTGNKVQDASVDDFKSDLSTYFDIDEQKQKGIKKLLKEKSSDDDSFFIYSFLFKVKELIMFGYFASEDIGENVLTYLPVPGKFDGCIPVEEVGRAWSL